MLKIGTRSSALAVLQAEYVKKNLLSVGIKNIAIVKIKTSGDKIKGPLYKIGGKGLFVKELEQAILSNKIDLAVHSMKDLPGVFHPDLDVLPILKRKAPNDVFISYLHKNLESLPKGAKIGTCAPRRIAQLRSDLIHMPIRGNIQTRLQKAEKLDGIILAKCALQRLKMEEKITEVIPVSKMIPAVCQGVLCAQFKKNNQDLKKILLQIVDKKTNICATAERAFLKKIKGDCTTPLAAFASLNKDQLEISAILQSKKGIFKIEKIDCLKSLSAARQIGLDVATDLIKVSGFNADN